MAMAKTEQSQNMVYSLNRKTNTPRYEYTAKPNNRGVTVLGIGHIALPKECLGKKYHIFIQEVAEIQAQTEHVPKELPKLSGGIVIG